MVFGGKTHVLPPCFDLPSSLVNIFIVFVEVVGAVMVGSGVWQAVSPFPRAHSTSELTSWWKKPPRGHTLHSFPFPILVAVYSSPHAEPSEGGVSFLFEESSCRGRFCFPHTLPTTQDLGGLFVPHVLMFIRVHKRGCSPSRRSGSLVHPHAQAIVLLDLTQSGGEPLVGGHSHFSTEWNRVCFSSIFWGSSAYVFLWVLWLGASFPPTQSV